MSEEIEPVDEGNGSIWDTGESYHERVTFVQRALNNEKENGAGGKDCFRPRQ